jgi:branched-chain amino acid transport system ATP-binding protein
MKTCWSPRGSAAGRRGEAPGFCMDILSRTGLAAVAEKPSGGLPLLQRKRLELARAMATRPRCHPLDEIAGGLTDAECVELVATIKAIHAEGTRSSGSNMSCMR